MSDKCKTSLPEPECDGCHEPSGDLVPCGRDAAGDPDAPSLCPACREDDERPTRPYMAQEAV